jgi:hypothetical protein
VTHSPVLGLMAEIENPICALGPLGPGDVVLVKGSLVAGLQPVAKRIAGGAPDNGE